MQDTIERQSASSQTSLGEAAFVIALGMTRGVNHDDYHNERSAVSSSQLKRMLISPAHFQHGMDAEEESSEAKLFGTVLHARLLEPDTFAQRFFAMPKVDRRTNQGKALAAAFDKAAEGMTAFPEAWRAQIDAMVKSARAHPKIAEILAQGEAEVALAWVDPETAVKCKCKPDWWAGPRLVADVKTALDISWEGFSRACAKYGYHLSAAMYVEGIEQVCGVRPDWGFIALEKEAPHCAAAYKASEGFLARGRNDFRKALRMLAHCRESGRYPGYQADGQWELMDLPRWA